MKVKEESVKSSLKLNIQKTKIMASIPITSRQIDGENVETVSDFIILESKINVDSEATKLRHLLLRRIAMRKLGSVLKSRDITLPKKVHMIKAIVFLVVM